MTKNTDFEALKDFINLAKESGVSELSYEHEHFKASVSFVSKGMMSPTMGPVLAQAADTNKTATDNKKNSEFIEVTSPFVGTFYRAPSPTAASYVNVGDRVSPGKALCIIEAMKIMNEIESEVSGEIVEICVENDTFVEYGQVLLRLKP